MKNETYRLSREAGLALLEERFDLAANGLLGMQNGQHVFIVSTTQEVSRLQMYVEGLRNALGAESWKYLFKVTESVYDDIGHRLLAQRRA